MSKTQMLHRTFLVSLAIITLTAFVSACAITMESEDANQSEAAGMEDLSKGKEAYSSYDYDAAAKYFALAAEQGNAEAQYRLGTCYSYGTGVELDYATALSWYRKAADQGYAPAQFEVGEYYALGRCVPQDVSKAKELHKKAIKGLEKAAKQGDPEAQFLLAGCYLFGYGEKNFDKAEKWYRKAAEQGYPRAQMLLGSVYLNGIGVKKDLSEAEKWLGKFVAGGRKAAEHGDAWMQYHLGQCYDSGLGAAQDDAEAAK